MDSLKTGRYAAHQISNDVCFVLFCFSIHTNLVCLKTLKKRVTLEGIRHTSSNSLTLSGSTAQEKNFSLQANMNKFQTQQFSLLVASCWAHLRLLAQLGTFATFSGSVQNHWSNFSFCTNKTCSFVNCT